MIGLSGKVYVTTEKNLSTDLGTTSWAHLPDLDPKIGYFGTLSSQGPSSQYFSLIVPGDVTY